jgi:hypothetical protein
MVRHELPGGRKSGAEAGHPHPGGRKGAKQPGWTMLGAAAFDIRVDRLSVLGMKKNRRCKAHRQRRTGDFCAQDSGA